MHLLRTDNEDANWNAFLVRMTIISLRVLVNVKTLFHLLYNSLTLIIQSWRGGGQEGFVKGALPLSPSVPPLATALILVNSMVLTQNG